jgi:hypothetical protein
MNNLIVSLSEDSNDASRREKVEIIFAEQLAQPGAERFAALFDSVLMTVGERVQTEARKKAIEAQEKEDPEQSGEHLQLWALIDMMVQTKTLVKRASGELGSEGSFQ